MDSWGYEISLKWQDRIGKDTRYWLGINLSYNQNEVLERKEAPQLNDYQYMKGHRIGSRLMYQFYRFYDDATPALYEKEFGEPFPEQLVQDLKHGDAVYVGLNHDGIIDKNDMSYSNGHTDDPEYTIGLNAGFTWKNFSLNMQWTGAWNVTRLLEGSFRYPFYSASTKEQGGLLKYIYDHSWTAEDPSQSAEYPRVTMANYDNNYATSTLYEKDAKYLRLKTVQITYDFNFPWMKRIGLNKLQLGLSGYNLLTFSPYIWGDPETRNGNSPSYPLQRTYSASLKFGF